MKVPGFTAEASLSRTTNTYQANALHNQDDQRVHAAQSQFIDRNYLSPISLRWPILEPNCVKICLPGWGGHCRWICF